MKQNKEQELKENKRRVVHFVKYQVFKDLKFIGSGHMTLLSLDPCSLCQFICTGLNIQPNDQQTYWNMYSGYVVKSLNTARNEAVAAMKKAFCKGLSMCAMSLSLNKHTHHLLIITRFY